ncbi:hypothetical protein GLOIN_2v1779851 [Rhizophagus irregularis DAOM 181602=DAOM 197198]|nr:hypothetical protein GLOIN_2v1779851 [Rhizophagus irregularis DAOM 181602=DAOM 197198]
MKKTKIRSGGLLKNENPKIKIHKFGFGWASEKRKPKGSGRLPKNENPKIKIHKFGWTSEKQKPKGKDSCGGLPKNENPKIKIHSGGLPKNENPKVKILRVDFRRTKKGEPLRFLSLGGFPSFQGTEKTKDLVSVFRRMEKTKILQWAFEEQRKPRFVSFGIFRKSGTKIRLVSRVDSDKQKKPKIFLVGFQKIKIRKYIRIHELCDCGIVD